MSSPSAASPSNSAGPASKGSPPSMHCTVQLVKLKLQENGQGIDSHNYKIFVAQKKPCSLCGRIYKNLKSHVERRHHSAVKCTVSECGAVFRELCELERHVRDASVPIERFECQMCGLPCLGRTQYRRHVHRVHKDFMKCAQMDCFSFFKTVWQSHEHFDAVHRRKALAIEKLCEHCPYFSTKKDELERHIEELHLPVKCSTCNEKWASRLDFGQHATVCSKLLATG